ncbi:MAG: phosphoribosylformylglycinamidine synthase I [Elusimicrobiota bacterium]
MNNKPKAIILRTAGTNCDIETQAAFELAGAHAERIHINRLIKKEVKLSDYQILAIPGGFSYGDDIASGKILANEIRNKLGADLKEFADNGKPVIGICNGFQVLVKIGLLPDEKEFKQKTTLSHNNSDKFECRWVYLKQGQGARVKEAGKNNCIWTKQLPDIIEMPVAHGEGKFTAIDEKTLRLIEKNCQVVFRYCDDKGKSANYPCNPNGSVNDIAGICNPKGNILGMMPHPERFIYKWQHPGRSSQEKNSEYGWGLKLFQNAVKYITENLYV